MVTIKKAKLTSMGYLEIEYERSVVIEPGRTVSIDVSEKPKWDPHPDLLNAFSALRIHLIRLCEQCKDIPSDDAERELLLSEFKVTGFVIGGSDEHEGVTIIGRKSLANNRVLNLVSPFSKWEDEHNGYDHAYELKLLVEACSEEVKEYLEGKKAPSKQKEIEFPENEPAEA